VPSKADVTLWLICCVATVDMVAMAAQMAHQAQDINQAVRSFLAEVAAA
jgi:hypothetical protein